MKQRTEALINELSEALEALGLESDVRDIKRFKAQMMSESELERNSAVKHLDTRCHVKWYGDLCLPIKREGDYPVYVFLDELRKAIREEVS